MVAFDAIYSNNIHALREYLELGDVNVVNERGLSLLHYAILFNNADIFNLLLENYINIDIKDSKGNTACHYCVVNNRIGFLKTLIRHHADLLIKNNEGQSVLYKACLLGREDMVSLLLESIPFDINEEDDKKESIFMALIRSRNINLLNKVVVNDNLINSKNYLNETPLHIACKSGDLKIVRYLLDNNAFVNSKNIMKETPIFYAIRSLNMDIVSLLLKYGACIDCKSSYGDTLYDFLPNNGIDEYVDELISRYKVDTYKVEYPLHYAILIESYNLCLKHCVIKNYNRKDKYGFTPMDLALKMDNHRIIELLKNFRHFLY